MILVDQQYRAAAGAAGAATVNIEQHQYKAPSPASAAVAAKQQQESKFLDVITAVNTIPVPSTYSIPGNRSLYCCTESSYEYVYKVLCTVI